MPLGDPYATVEALKARLGIAETDTGDDTRLAQALNAASRGIEHCTARQFHDAGAASARTFPVDSPYRADLDDLSTADGLLVEVDRTRNGTYAETWTSADYELAPAGGVVEGVPGWPFIQINAVGARTFPYCAGERASARPALRVTGRWGWSTVPAPIAEACLIVAAEIYKLRDAPFGVAGFGEWGMIRVRQNPIAAAMISPYERYRVLVG
ncbi:hypothetical protein [Actinomadura sp. 9N215]|uniref:hypothetical protein n=1 Tax=Actinomadura sp. 9N215 TaxID=3375150 RepID=UPI003788D256